MTKKIDFSSPQSAGAIVSQFYLSLEKCFEMGDGDYVYIEKDGDVSKTNPLIESCGEQIEFKEFGENDNLTNSHLNFWNTLKNWSNPKFNSNKYKYLILATTQDIGINSSLNEWNSSTTDKRKEILENIYDEAKRRYSYSIQKDPRAKKTDSLLLMESVFSDEKRLELIIDKIFIDSKRTRRKDIAQKLKQKQLKPFPSESHNQVLNSLLGFVVRAEDYNTGWEISNDSFNKQLQDLSSIYNNQSTIFPIDNSLKKLPEIEKEKTLKYNFVKKIEDIQYDKAIPKSLNDYWFTFNTIAKEFSSRKQKMKSIEQFQEELINIHNSAHSRYSRKCDKKKIISNSQNFYDYIIEKEAPSFDNYNNTPSIFKNGMYHMLAEESDKIVWKLNSNLDE